MPYSTLRIIAQHIRGFWAPLAAAMGLAAVLGIIATAVLALLGTVVAQGITQRFDERVLRALEGLRSPLLTEVMIEITTIGSGVPLMLMVALTAILLWLSQHRWSAALLVLASLGGTLMSRLLKDYFDRPRPSVVDAVQEVTSLSFPSGHATSSFIVYGTIAYLVARLAPRRAVRVTIRAFAILMIVLVGISRMYLGVHYPTDVIGGFLTGLAWVMVLAASMTAVRYLVGRRPETEAEERDLEQPTTPDPTR